MLDYQSFLKSDSLILFIDYFKAFDSIEHSFLFQTLEYFGFDKNFCSIIKMLYTDIFSYVSCSGITPRINVTRGIRQGCPISPETIHFMHSTIGIPCNKPSTISGHKFL